MSNNQQNAELEKRFSKAVEFHSAGKIGDACRIYEEILETIPDSPLVNYNLGLALYEMGNYEKSCSHYRQTILHAPEDTDVLYNYALALKKAGKKEKAIAIYQKILQSIPGDIDTLYNLGCVYKDNGDEKKALLYFNKVIEKKPSHKSSLNNAAYLYHKNGDFEKAKHYYGEIIRLNPDDISANHMIMSLSGKTPQSAAPEYVEQVFDAYAEHYEKSLVDELNYSVPINIRKQFDSLFFVKKNSKIALDVGCGTGLGGEVFSDICKHIAGVDISQEMLNIADKKCIYSSLHAAEITDFLQKSTDSYDLIIATDVFTYMGDLNNIFGLLSSVAKANCHFCFSTEFLENKPFHLRKSGRFAHSKDYIHKVCIDNGWKIVDYTNTNLRQEKGKWIEGILYFCTNNS